MNWRTFFVVLVAYTVTVGFVGVAEGNGDYIPIILKPCDLYGHVGNADPGICAAAATINSFVYLQNQYPGTYDQKLVPDTDGNGVIDSVDWSAARDALAYGWDSRSGMYGGSDPGSAQSIWENKVWWIEDHAPGTTVFDGQTEFDPTGWYHGDVLEHVLPEWEFLLDELVACEDIELLIWPCIEGDDPVGHCVTLTGLGFNDLDGDGEQDPNEPFALNYLDPNAPDACIWADIVLCTQQPGALAFNWWQEEEVYYIDSAYVESPVPEASALVVWFLFTGLVVTLAWRRRKRTAT